ncbi:adenylyltransferase/cytidyltransferase family protein [Candidatus Woesearchaeota archaeon]|nr:adenylyltransferase/cytidyltransferase family protein [Candidatus Woesearchaeota archaeon]
MKKIMVFGTFNILHQGHLSLFEQAKKLGEALYVVVACNETVARLKNYTPTDEKERMDRIKSVKVVDYVLLGDLKDKFKAIKEIKPEVIGLGYDQTFFVDDLENFIAENGFKVEIVRLKAFHPNKYKSRILMGKERSGGIFF